MFPTTVNASPGVVVAPICTFPATIKLPVPPLLASTVVAPPCDKNCKQPFVSNPIEPEAFGRVSVEAQAMRKPILASNHGGSKETILNGKSGFLYKTGDPRELAQVLNNVMELDEEALYSIGKEGRRNVTKRFDVEQMCKTTFTEYKKLFRS